MTYTFDSFFNVGAQLPEFTQEEIKNEPMLFNCDTTTARALGGPITKAFIDLLLSSSRHTDWPTVIDSRVHMLKKGWFPAIPGFHHDDVPRSGVDGQPNYDNPEYRSKHAMAIVNGAICPTEFALGYCKMSKVPDGEIIYKQWHKEVEEQCDQDILKRVNAPQNKIIYFDDRAFHQATRAVDDGWRFFIRASYFTNRVPTNELRRQVQVYLEHPMEGW